ncbi:MAG: hypothetical protein JJT94_11530 [Bernardetiaceae bacterium]|nr:hypothetical protein [Bernardetiaceae bacterium]
MRVAAKNIVEKRSDNSKVYELDLNQAILFAAPLWLCFNEYRAQLRVFAVPHVRDLETARYLWQQYRCKERRRFGNPNWSVQGLDDQPLPLKERKGIYCTVWEQQGLYLQHWLRYDPNSNLFTFIHYNKKGFFTAQSTQPQVKDDYEQFVKVHADSPNHSNYNFIIPTSALVEIPNQS